ncbi:MAG: NAD(P)-dependent oxidoreductase [Litorilinea sp.]
MKRKVLITGAAGRIGSFLTKQWLDTYDMVLTDVREPANDHGLPFHQLNLSEFDKVRPLCDDVDTVIHLGADPSMEAPWESLLPNNLISTYNVFESAKQAGCRRVIFASSVNAVLGYPTDVQVHMDQQVWPINIYGATKCWGEALGAYYGTQTGTSIICLRFGWVVDRASEAISHKHPFLDIAFTYEDLTQLVSKSVEAPEDYKFKVYMGVSNNRWKRLDISTAREELGYTPVDDSFEIAKQREAGETK